MQTFSARLRTAREAAGYASAQQFAGVLGVEPHTYRKYERGSSEPNFETLLRICELLEVEPNYLLPLSKKSLPDSKGQSGPGQAQAA